ncbi:MAG: hypothetical protein WC891_04125 [Actinomycetota bacterium]
MKVYAVVVTVVLLVCLAAGGLVIVKQGGDLQAIEKNLQTERRRTGDAQRQLKDLQDGVVAIKVTSLALQAAVNAPIIPGDVKIDRIEDAAATDARQKLGDITDQKDREMALADWDALRNGGRVVDYQSVLRSLSQNITRNLEPKK